VTSAGTTRRELEMKEITLKGVPHILIPSHTLHPARIRRSVDRRTCGCCGAQRICFRDEVASRDIAITPNAWQGTGQECCRQHESSRMRRVRRGSIRPW
jgi:hypothetical protein